LFADLKLDETNYGTSNWNPLGKYVVPNGKIAIKPNWVWDPPYCFQRPECLFATVTHSSLLRAIIDYSYIAVGKRGRISILDSPIEDTSWTRLHKWNLFDDVFRFYKKHTDVPIEMIDIRDLESVRSKRGISLGKRRLSLVHRRSLPGDPRGSVKLEMNLESEFSKWGLAEYGCLRSPQKWTKREVLKYHSKNKHTYYISRTLMEADLIVNVPKLKHHKKAGVTLSLKNFIGATSRKNGLPHFRAGNPPKGDEYPFPRRSVDIIKSRISDINLLSTFGFSIRGYEHNRDQLPCDSAGCMKHQLYRIKVGDWHGTDTLWRTILDLNKAVLCGDLNGILHDTRQRQYLSIIDGIVGGDGDSPLHPRPRKAGLLLSSEDPVALDIAATYLMEFDPHKIPTLEKARSISGLRPEAQSIANTEVVFNGTETTTLGELRNFLKQDPRFTTRFMPSIGWIGHIELD
jgi:hypothetical protein